MHDKAWSGWAALFESLDNLKAAGTDGRRGVAVVSGNHGRVSRTLFTHHNSATMAVVFGGEEAKFVATVLILADLGTLGRLPSLLRNDSSHRRS